MPEGSELAVIYVGYKTSPFINYLVETENVACSFLTNNSCDFEIHHADPSKVLQYHLEFSNIIEAKSKKNIESLAIFETLGQFFEFYNPLHLSTLNYLVSKYATNILNNKTILETWTEISNSIFDEDFIYPIFEETRIFHVKVGDEEVPARQFIISTELKKKKKEEKLNGEQKKEDGKAAQKSKKKKEKDNGDAAEKVPEIEKREEVSGIIDLDDVQKLTICEEAAKKIQDAAAVVIVATDMLSPYILFQSAELKGILKEAPAKIAFIMPNWPGNEISPSEINVLVNSNFNAEPESIVELVKDFVDIIIIDDKDSEIISQIRDAGITAIVEDLSPEGQKKQDLLETVLKSTDLSLESVKLESKKEHGKIGKKIVDILSSRFSGKEDEGSPEEDEQAEESLVEPPEEPEPDQEKDDKDVEQKTGEESAEAPEESKAPQVDAGMEEPAGIQQEKSGEPKVAANITGEVKAEGERAVSNGPKPEKIPAKEEETPSPEKDEEIDPEKILDEKIDKVLMPSYEENLESVFSDLLTIQDTPEAMHMVFDNLIEKFATMDDLGPEKRIVNILTYIASNKPDEYTDICLEKLRIIVQSIDKKIRTPELHTISLLMRYSKPIGEKVLGNFVNEFILEENFIVIERTRNIMDYFISKDEGFIQIVLNQLLSLFREELKKEEPSEKLLDKITFFLYSVDAFTLGQAMIEEFPKSLFDKVKETFLKDHSNRIYAQILIDILDSFLEGSYEKLKTSLGVQKIPEKIKGALLKKKYISNLSKVGSIPLEVFAEKSGLSVEEAEKIVYEMIVKGDITAKIELVNNRPYVVQEVTEKKEEEKKEEAKEEEPKKTETNEEESKEETENEEPEEEEKEEVTKVEEEKTKEKNEPKVTDDEETEKSISKQVKKEQIKKDLKGNNGEDEAENDIPTQQRKCPSCGESAYIQEKEDKDTILSYTPSIVYAKKFLCANCNQEWKKGEEAAIREEVEKNKKKNEGKE